MSDHVMGHVRRSRRFRLCPPPPTSSLSLDLLPGPLAIAGALVLVTARSEEIGTDEQHGNVYSATSRKNGTLSATDCVGCSQKKKTRTFNDRLGSATRAKRVAGFEEGLS